MQTVYTFRVYKLAKAAYLHDLNTLRQKGRRFADDTFKRISLN